MKLTRREVCGLLLASPLAAAIRYSIGLSVSGAEVLLRIGDTAWRFTRESGSWSLESVLVRGTRTAQPLSRRDGFIIGAGEADKFELVTDSAEHKEIRFSGQGFTVAYRVDAAGHLPRVFIAIQGVSAPICAWRTGESAADQHGAWATRGETASDAEGREVFIDGSGRLVFGHSRVGTVDAAYVLQAEVLDNIHPRGKSMQASDTWFKSGRMPGPDSKVFGYWQIRIGAPQPKQFGIVFDRDLGGRLHDVCEKYYAAAVASQVDISKLTSDYNPELCVEKMPVRLSCPESLVPGYGWHMEEYFPGYGKAAYPFGDESGIQTGALLAFEGHATGRAWEKNFGKYVVDQMPLWGEADGKGYFTKRPGGWTRWAYHCDYQHPFPFMEGGNWTAAEQLYWVAKLFNDGELKQRSLELMKHDVFVKLDLDRMTFPPCWNPDTKRLTDHRDDWNITACLGYCAEISSEILYPETRDPQYLRIADRITDWLRSIWGPEQRMNFLHPKVNTFHCWMGWLTRALVHRYERGGEREFLDIAQDLAWVLILALCTTDHKDSRGRPLIGVTCVGVRGCVDYDCTPNLCQEKDQAFWQNMGPLFRHVSGPGYAAYIALTKFVLPRDSWQQAFRIQDQRDLNLRTNYDNYVRGMTNLAFALNKSSDPEVAALETLVSDFNTRIDRARGVVLSNATGGNRETLLQLKYLQEGRYEVTFDGRPLGTKSAEQLSAGIRIAIPSQSTRRLTVKLVSLQRRAMPSRSYDSSVIYLSELTPMDSQRGIGLPDPVYRRDKSLLGTSLSIAGKTYGKGLGLAANTVLVYKLSGDYARFAGSLGIPDDAPVDGPPPSVNVTMFADGHCRFTSGAVTRESGLKAVEFDLRGVDTLVVRVSSNWDDGGDLRNDLVNLVEARLIGKAGAHSLGG